MRLKLTSPLGVVALLTTASALAEGTKQLSPSSSDTTALIVNNGNYANFAAPGGPAENRLLVHLADPDNEQVFFGFSEGFAQINKFDGPNNHPRQDFIYRVWNPDRTQVVKNWTLVDASNDNLETFAQVTAGPAALNPADQNAYANPAEMTFVPGQGLAPGDYIIEITGYDVTAQTTQEVYIPRFDVTVATRGANPQELPGRLHSPNWAISSPTISVNPPPGNFGDFNRPFNGAFYVYSPEGFVSKVDFAGAGFQPFAFNVSFNGTGPASAGSLLADARSVEARSTNPEYKIFLQAPPADIYPSGTFGRMFVNDDYPKLYGCAGGEDYYVEVATNSVGQVEVFFDADGDDGRFTPGTADRMLSLAVEPAPGEAAPYIRRVPWDGKDGLGVAIADASLLPVTTVTFSQIPYHLPIYDAEYMLNGFEVEIIRPFSPAQYTIKYQWDDRAITEAPITAQGGTPSPKTQLQGDQNTLHRWDNSDYGNENTINTYWYARREVEPVTLQRADPIVGCTPAQPSTIAGTVFNDRDADKRRDANEAVFDNVDVWLYADTDGDGQRDPGASPIAQIQTGTDGKFTFDVAGQQMNSTRERGISATEHDAVEVGTEYYGNLGFGAVGPNATGREPAITSMYFSGFALPGDATVQSATITVVGAGQATGEFAPADATVAITAELVASPNAPSTNARPSGRTVTTAQTSWNVDAAQAGVPQTTPDLATVLQEVVDASGAAGLTDIHFVARGQTTGGLNLFQQGNEANPAVLTVAYRSSGTHYVLRIDPAAGVRTDRIFTTGEEPAVVLPSNAASSAENDFGLAGDRDRDGVVDGEDLDNDNDGIADASEDGGTGLSPTGDADGDGVLNFADPFDSPDGGATPGPAYANWKDENNDGVNDRYDADGDGVPDVYDLDSDNDGLTDLAEAGGTDADGDGLVDDATDSDGDGLADLYDNNDVDGPRGQGIDPGTPSTSALVDTDADGTPDGGDADGDGIPNWADLDADNDGMTDAAENDLPDADGDGRVDAFADADGDGLADAIDPAHDGPLRGTNAAPAAGAANATVDTDGDGVANHLDIDTDGDGIADVVEAGATDADGDCRVDFAADADGDGLADRYDGTHAGPAATTTNAPAAADAGTALGAGPDTDGDGVPDARDLDADNDGIADVTEAGGHDADGDGRADADADADGDGLADAYDSAHDGPASATATAPSAGVALANTAADRGDGKPSEPAPASDGDGDGLPTWLDLDSDNDNLADVAEHGGTDANGDGRADDFADVDGDGLNDALDGDVGNDGTAEQAARALVQHGPDADADGRPDTYASGDTDADGRLDAQDLDADDDGIADVTEAGGTDANGDGRGDDFADADGDGLADAVDGDPNGALAAGSDAPGVNTADALVLTSADADGDGRPDAYVKARDTDGDGVADRVDLDSDDDGIADIIEAGGADADGDGRADGTADADQDGFADAYDADPANALAAGDDAAGSNDAGVLVRTGDDADGDGAPDGMPGNDTDGDGVLDFRDLDADNDGIPDLVEARGVDADGDGRVDDATDADGDGLADVVDGDDDRTAATGDGNGALVITDAAGAVTDAHTGQMADHDGDGFANWLDRDADGDGNPDLVEARVPAGNDADGDGRIDAQADADGDGLYDAFDGDANDGPTAGNGGNADGNPVLPTAADTDADGTTIAEGFGESPTSTDADGLPNFLDLDSDDDGVTDNVEQHRGFTEDDRSDGTQDGRNTAASDYKPYGMTDADGDGVPDRMDDYPFDPFRFRNPNAEHTVSVNAYGEIDSDGDGVPDHLDLDADNDGLLDNYEAVCTGCPTAGVTTGADANYNGVIDAFEGLTAANATGGDRVGATPQDLSFGDNDGVYDYLDLDTDGDGDLDFSEGFDDDKDGLSEDDLKARATDYEAFAASPNRGHYVNADDTDGDGLPDWLDNVDGPGYDEDAPAPFLTPGTQFYGQTFWTDINGNGVADLYDAALGGTPSVMPDRDGANDADWRDAGTSAPVPVTLVSFGAEAADCDVVATWSVGAELALSHYVLEASADGTHFAAVAKTPATGASTYAARSASQGARTYLRLRAIDLDGTEDVSEVIVVDGACATGIAFEAMPNPVSVGATVTVRTARAGEVTLVDAVGRVMTRVYLEAGASAEVSTAGLTPGMYILRSGTRTERLIVR